MSSIKQRANIKGGLSLKIKHF